MLHGRETLAVSSFTLKVLTFNGEGWDTFVDTESIGKSAEPQSSRHLLSPIPCFRGASVPARTLTSTQHNRVAQVSNYQVLWSQPSCVCFPTPEYRDLFASSLSCPVVLILSL